MSGLNLSRSDRQACLDRTLVIQVSKSFLQVSFAASDTRFLLAHFFCFAVLRQLSEHRFYSPLFQILLLFMEPLPGSAFRYPLTCRGQVFTDMVKVQQV